MPAQRLGKAKLDRREPLGQFRPRLRQIAANMDAGRQKVWHKNDALGPSLDAANAAFLDARPR
jgi:hypothetical protein